MDIVAVPTFSLIVATVERTGELAAFLDSARLSHEKNFEVIVVDQNRDARLVPLISAFEHAFAIRHVRVDFRGACRARNIGAQLARSDWLTFPDDDSCLLQGTLDTASDLFMKSRATILVGRTVHSGEQPVSRSWFRREGFFTLRNMPLDISESALFVKADAFASVGGFDVNLGPGAPFYATEGADLIIRILRAGAGRTALLSHSLTLYHPRKVPPWNEDACRRAYEYGCGNGAVAVKFPRLRMRHLCVALMVGLVGSIIFRKGRGCWYRQYLRGIVDGYLAYRRRRTEA